MTQLNLVELISHGETQEVEFKKSLRLRREGLEALCGMINTDAAYGIVIFGVEDDGSICGIESGNIDVAQCSLIQHIRSTFAPCLYCELKISSCGDKNLLILRAARDKNISFYEYDSRAWIREGTTTRCLTLQEKRNFERKRNRDMWHGPWKCDQCGSYVGQLSCLIYSEHGVKKAYQCSCGGEFWPIS